MPNGSDEIKVFKCYSCGKGIGYIQSLKPKMVLEGRLSEGRPVGMRQTNVLLTDKPPQTQLVCPVATVIEDICEKCGCIFVREIRIGKVTATVQPNMPKRGFR